MPEDDEVDGEIFLRLRPGTPGFTGHGILTGEVLLTPRTAGAWALEVLGSGRFGVAALLALRSGVLLARELGMLLAR